MMYRVLWCYTPYCNTLIISAAEKQIKCVKCFKSFQLRDNYGRLRPKVLAQFDNPLDASKYARYAKSLKQVKL